MQRAERTIHNHRGTRVYKAWCRMKNRCNNPKATQYKWYGGRGIRVCDRWNASFLNFLADMGEPPTEKHTIERRDSNGNYEKGNCEWATQKQQSANKRPRSDTVWLTHKGETMSVTDWAKRTGIYRHTIFRRIGAGWDTDSVLTRDLFPGMSLEGTHGIASSHSTLDRSGRKHRVNGLLTYRRRSMPLLEWSRELRIPWATLYNRLSRGWGIKRAFTTPARSMTRKSALNTN